MGTVAQSREPCTIDESSVAPSRTSQYREKGALPSDTGRTIRGVYGQLSLPSCIERIEHADGINLCIKPLHYTVAKQHALFDVRINLDALYYKFGGMGGLIPISY